MFPVQRTAFWKFSALCGGRKCLFWARQEFLPRGFRVCRAHFPHHHQNHVRDRKITLKYEIHGYVAFKFRKQLVHSFSGGGDSWLTPNAQESPLNSRRRAPSHLFKLQLISKCSSNGQEFISDIGSGDCVAHSKVIHEKCSARILAEREGKD